MNRLFTIESFSKNIRVLLTRSGLALGQKINNKIKELNNFEIIACQNPSPDLIFGEPFDIVIHLVGFDPPSFAETLYHTSILHQLLDLCLKHKARFILVTASENSALKEVAVSLVKQFNKLFSVNFDLVEVQVFDNQDEITDEILKKFIHKNQLVKLKKDPVEPEKKPQHENVRPRIPKIARNIATLLLFLISSIVFVGLFRRSYNYLLSCATSSVDKGNWNQAVSCAKFSKYFPKSKNLANLILDLSRVGEAGTKIVSGRSEDLENFAGSISFVQERIAETTLDTDDENIRKKLSSWRDAVRRIRLVIDDLPIILGFGKSTEYLVLLQDSQELRPTGGFIDGIGILTVTGGKIDSVQLLTSSTADGLLKGSVKAPGDLQKALGESLWYLRDSNWNPSFPQSAAQAAWFLEKQLGKKVQIVVGLNTRSLAKILAATGPVSVDGFAQKIEGKNLLDLTLTNASADLTKRSLSLGVFQSLLAKIPTLTEGQLGILGSAIFEELDSRQLLVAGVNGINLPNIRQAGWDGGLEQIFCPGVSPCVSDTIHVVSSNMGINKTNAKVNTALTIDSSLSSESVNVSVGVSIANKAVVNAWPIGNYKNYLRFYLPASAKLTAIMVGNKPLVQSDFEITQTSDFLVVGTLVNVPVNSTLNVGVNFVRNLPKLRRFVYTLNVPNQPGMSDSQQSIYVRYPTNWLTQASSQAQVVSSGLFRYNTSTNKPFRASFDFLKNE